MDAVAKAAADTGDLSLLYFVLTVAGGAIVLLCAALVYLYKTRVAQQGKTVTALVDGVDKCIQQMALLHEKNEIVKTRLDIMDRQDDIREKRLQEGSKTMRELRDENRKVYDELIKRISELSTQIATISERNVLSIGGLINVERFDRYCISHENKHDVLDRDMKNIKESQDEFKLELRSIGVKLETGLGTMTRMLSGITRLGSADKENSGQEP